MFGLFHSRRNSNFVHFKTTEDEQRGFQQAWVRHAWGSVPGSPPTHLNCKYFKLYCRHRNCDSRVPWNGRKWTAVTWTQNVIVQGLRKLSRETLFEMFHIACWRLSHNAELVSCCKRLLTRASCWYAHGVESLPRAWSRSAYTPGLGIWNFFLSELEKNSERKACSTPCPG